MHHRLMSQSFDMDCKYNTFYRNNTHLPIKKAVKTNKFVDLDC